MAALLLAPTLLVAACSGDEPSTAVTTVPTSTAVGDSSCDDVTGDVYLTSDPTASPTGRVPAIDLVSADATLGDDELTFRFETVAPIEDALFPEVIVFAGGATEPDRYEVRAVRGDDGWAVRRITFVDGAPVEAGLAATVEAHGTVVTFSVPAGVLPPPGDFISFAFASTAVDGTVSVNDECFPFAGRTPVGG